MKLKTYWYLGLFLLFSAAAHSSRGCVLTKAPPSLETEMATAVFSGKVTAIEYQPEDTGNGEPQRIRVKTQKWWKGSGSDEILIYTNKFRRFDGENWQIWHYTNALDFSVGESYLIYAFVDSKNVLGTTKCTRTKLLSEADFDLTKLGEGFPPEIISNSPINRETGNLAVSQDEPEPEEYSVYTVVLQEMFSPKEDSGNQVKELVVKKRTVFPESYTLGSQPTLLTHGGRSLSNAIVEKETIENFRSRRTQPAELTDKFNLNLKINLIRDKVDQISAPGYGEDGLDILRKHYPGADGIISLSRVGFNKEKTQAFVYVTDVCGWTCGTGFYILLAKKNDKWKIEGEIIAWVS